MRVCPRPCYPVGLATTVRRVVDAVKKKSSVALSSSCCFLFSRSRRRPSQATLRAATNYSSTTTATLEAKMDRQQLYLCAAARSWRTPIPKESRNHLIQLRFDGPCSGGGGGEGGVSHASSFDPARNWIYDPLIWIPGFCGRHSLRAGSNTTRRMTSSSWRNRISIYGGPRDSFAAIEGASTTQCVSGPRYDSVSSRGG